MGIITSLDNYELESKILESRKNVNYVAELLSRAYREFDLQCSVLTRKSATVALTRVFCKLISLGYFSIKVKTSSAHKILRGWLIIRYNEFINLLNARVVRSRKLENPQCVVLLMLLLKNFIRKMGKWNSKKVKLDQYVHKLLFCDHESNILGKFWVKKYLTKYPDLLYHTVKYFNSCLEQQAPRLCQIPDKCEIANACELLLFVDLSSCCNENSTNFVPLNATNKVPIAALKDELQQAWLHILNAPLNRRQYEFILNGLVDKIVPCTSKPYLFLDFLTDAFNSGGSTSLLALSGIYYLIRDHNLEYPQFYRKVYSLLDEDLLYSAYLDRFFSLLNEFLSSTHLPSVLLASFIKRLCRLALRGPPGGIILVIPFVYNLLKSHPTTTFMIHRVVQTESQKEQIDQHGFIDPFNPNEPDPMLTNAIDSCLWEVVTLQSHYHPSVSVIATILAQEFLKESYPLDDFTGYTYSKVSARVYHSIFSWSNLLKLNCAAWNMSMIDKVKQIIKSELNRVPKSEPAVEYPITTNVFVDGNGKPNVLGNLFSAAIKPVGSAV